eukprot:m.31326 g.31326  ORF g.31326 m.31326 type:complete len:613 (+) comp8304_c0_seq1:254-2092(+)
MPTDSEWKMHLGEKVQVEGKGGGTLRYYGPTKKSKGAKKCGVELELPNGSHDGSVGGVKYFICEPLYGTLMDPEKVTMIQRESIRRGSKPKGRASTVAKTPSKVDKKGRPSVVKKSNGETPKSPKVIPRRSHVKGADEEPTEQEATVRTIDTGNNADIVNVVKETVRNKDVALRGGAIKAVHGTASENTDDSAGAQEAKSTPVPVVNRVTPKNKEIKKETDTTKKQAIEPEFDESKIEIEILKAKLELAEKEKEEAKLTAQAEATRMAKLKEKREKKADEERKRDQKLQEMQKQLEETEKEKREIERKAREDAKKQAELEALRHQMKQVELEKKRLAEEAQQKNKDSEEEQRRKDLEKEKLRQELAEVKAMLEKKDQPPPQTASSADQGLDEGSKQELEKLRQELEQAKKEKAEVERKSKEQMDVITSRVLTRMKGGQQAVEEEEAERRQLEEKKAMTEKQRQEQEKEAERIRKEKELLDRKAEEAEKMRLETIRLQKEAEEKARQAELKAKKEALRKQKEEERKRIQEQVEREKTFMEFSEQWSSAKLCAWLGNMGFAKEAKIFAEHDLDAGDIMVLLPEDLDEMGIVESTIKKDLLDTLMRAKSISLQQR